MFGNSNLKRAFLSVFLVVLVLALQISADQLDIPGPTGTGAFGTTVVVLPTGGILVVDPGYDIPGANDVGAVFLFDRGIPETGAAFAFSPEGEDPFYLRALYFGEVTNDQVGSGGLTVVDQVYIVYSPHWNNDRGAITICSATTGCSGSPSPSNSLTGPTPGSQIGSHAERYYKALNEARKKPFVNVNYDLPAGISPGCNAKADCSSPQGSIPDVGSVTFCDLTEPCVGVVGPDNSLVGTSAGDQIGSGGVTALSNGNYVLNSPVWDNPSSMTGNVGAVTWCSGTTGCTGTVSAGNSLVGARANDRVGETGITALTNGGYVVRSTGWDNPSPVIVDAGAATFCSASAPCTGLVTASNSLIGGTATDWVGNGAIALENGNYVVSSPIWDNPSLGASNDAGAATFCSSAAPCTGLVTASNSLVGSTVGERLGNSGVTALTNGNYVVATPGWDNPSPVRGDAGAATFCTAAAPCTGPITASNSLIGGTANDQVGNNRVTALTNGNYVVLSPNWRNAGLSNAGAATWGNGTTGTIGPITSTNSLVGGSSSDFVGSGVNLLANGHYVVRSSFWDNPSPFAQDVGAVTWCNANGTTVGTVTATNSLVGGRAFDSAGNSGLTALINGNYVVASRLWDNPSPVIADVGAVTWGNGNGGTVGPISVSNSLIGGTANDQVGNGAIGGAAPVTELPGGNYAVTSTNWDNPSPAIANASAVTFGNGVTGTSGLVSSANSVLGTVAAGTNTFSYDELRNGLFVGRAASNIVSLLFFNTTAISDGDFTNPATWDNGVPNGYTNGVIPNGRTVTLTSPSTVGLLSVGCTGTIAGASSTAYINGNVEKDYCPPAFGDDRAVGGQTFTYPLGDGTNYSPVTASNVGGTGSLLAHVTDATLPGLYASQSASRFWTLSGSGITADLSFTYVDADVNGTEAGYKLFKRSSGAATPVTPFSLNVGTNTITATGVSSFSDWGVGNLAPLTAAGVAISGTVRGSDGRGITNAVMTLSGGDLKEPRTVLTGRRGQFTFTDIPAGRTYLISVRSRRFYFEPSSRLITVMDDIANEDFTAQPDK